MAYTTPNRHVIRRWEKAGRRAYAVYTAQLKIGTTTQQVATGGGVSAPAATAADLALGFKCPGRIVGVQYGIRGATGTEALAAATGGALVVKAETTAGVQIWTDGDISSIQDGFQPVGTTAVNQARSATAATDAFSGGFPVRGGVFLSITGGTAGELITVEFMVRHTTYIRGLFYPVGVAGSATQTTVHELGGPGSLAALAIDFGSAVPAATTDVTFTADDATTGTALFTSTNSATDLAPQCLGVAGSDEAKAATAATDGTEGCNGFKHAIVAKIAQADPGSTANNTTVYELWIDD